MSNQEEWKIAYEERVAKSKAAFNALGKTHQKAIKASYKSMRLLLEDMKETWSFNSRDADRMETAMYELAQAFALDTKDEE